MSGPAERPRGRWLVPSAVAALAAIAGLVAVVWAIGPDKRADERDPELAAQAAADEVHQRGVVFEEQITGTGAQVAAGQFLDQYRREQAFVDCMHRRGYPDETWTFYNTWVGWRPLTAFDSGVGWLNPLDSHVVSDDALRLAPLQIATSGELGPNPPDDAPGYLDDRRACHRARIALPDGVVVDQGGVVPGAADLHTAFIGAGSGLMRRLSQEHGDDYADCMLDRGYDSVALPYEAHTLLRSVAPKPTDAPVGDGPATAEWTTFLEKEDAVLAADDACRQDVYVSAMDEAGLILDRFTAKHSSGIGAMAQKWQAILEAAEGLGFDPAKARQTFS